MRRRVAQPILTRRGVRQAKLHAGRFRIDFTGGSLLQVRYDTLRPDISAIEKEVSTIPLGAVSVRASGADGVVIRTRTLAALKPGAILLLHDSSPHTAAALPELLRQIGEKRLVVQV